MKYLLALVTFLLGLSIGYFFLKGPEKRKFVLQRSIGTAPLLNETVAGPKAMTSAVLPVEAAEGYLANFIDAYPNSSISFTIDSIHCIRLLSHPMASGGLRAYFGLKDRSEPDSVTLMFVGVDEDRENVFFNFDNVDYVIDYTNPCPKDCPLDAQGQYRRTLKP